MRASSRWRSSSRSADSEATEWIRRTCGHDQAHAPALQLADEVPLEQLPVRGDLLPAGPARGSRRRGARRPRRAPAGPRRRRTSSPRARRPRDHPAAPGARRARRRRRARRARARGSPRTRSGAQAGDQLNHATPAWRPARAPSRRWEKKRSSQIVHAVHVAHLGTPAASSRSRAIARRSMLLTLRGGRRRTQRAPPGRPHSSRRPAPGPDDRDDPERCLASSRSARTPSSSTPAASPRQPAWTIATAAAQPSATGRQSALSTITPSPASAVAWPSASIGHGLAARLRRAESHALHHRPVHLVAAHSHCSAELPRRRSRAAAPAVLVRPRRRRSRGCRRRAR